MVNKDLLNKVQAIFPQSNLNNAVNQVEGFMNQNKGKNPSNILRSAGITEQAVNQIYNRYANNPKTNLVLGLLGYDADTIKQEALNILNSNSSSGNKPKSTMTSSKFPRLK